MPIKSHINNTLHEIDENSDTFPWDLIILRFLIAQENTRRLQNHERAFNCSAMTIGDCCFVETSFEPTKENLTKFPTAAYVIHKQQLFYVNQTSQICEAINISPDTQKFLKTELKTPELVEGNKTSAFRTLSDMDLDLITSLTNHQHIKKFENFLKKIRHEVDHNFLLPEPGAPPFKCVVIVKEARHYTLLGLELFQGKMNIIHLDAADSIYVFKTYETIKKFLSINDNFFAVKALPKVGSPQKTTDGGCEIFSYDQACLLSNDQNIFKIAKKYGKKNLLADANDKNPILYIPWSHLPVEYVWHAQSKNFLKSYEGKRIEFLNSELEKGADTKFIEEEKARTQIIVAERIDFLNTHIKSDFRRIPLVDLSVGQRFNDLCKTLPRQLIHYTEEELKDIVSFENQAPTFPTVTYKSTYEKIIARIPWGQPKLELQVLDITSAPKQTPNNLNIFAESKEEHKSEVNPEQKEKPEKGLDFKIP